MNGTVSIQQVFTQDSAAALEEFISTSSNYLINKNTTKEQKNTFWIAILNNKVIGCSGLAHNVSSDDSELIIVVVSEEYRNNEIGRLLVKAADDYCVINNILRIRLTTDNSRAKRFFHNYCNFSFNNAAILHVDVEHSIAVPTMVKYFGERLYRKIAIVGGTHGNEKIGIALARHWTTSINGISNSQRYNTDGDSATDVVKRPSFTEVFVLIGNPSAAESNERYKNLDLNRVFAVAQDAGRSSSFSSNNIDSKNSNDYEIERSAEIQSVIGSKTDDDNQCDYVIDLHSTTSNLGLLAIVAGGETDVTTMRVLVSLKLLHPTLRVLFIPAASKRNGFSVESLGRSGISFEVGPLPHNTLRSYLLEHTRKLVTDTLDILHSRNQTLLASVELSENNINKKIVWASEISSKDANLFSTYTSSGNNNGDDSTIYGEEIEAYVAYKKISYPNDNCCVHPSIEDADYSEIMHGQPCFIATDGSNEVIPFQHPDHGSVAIENLRPLYLLFINEASYQENNVAFIVCEKKTVPVL